MPQSVELSASGIPEAVGYNAVVFGMQTCGNGVVIGKSVGGIDGDQSFGVNALLNEPFEGGRIEAIGIVVAVAVYGDQQNMGFVQMAKGICKGCLVFESQLARMEEKE